MISFKILIGKYFDEVMGVNILIVGVPSIVNISSGSYITYFETATGFTIQIIVQMFCFQDVRNAERKTGAKGEYCR